MGFDAIDELFDETIVLPIKGRKYTIPSPSASAGLRMQRLLQGAVRADKAGVDPDKELLDDLDEIALFRDTLGPAFDEMDADGVSFAWVKHAAMTATVWSTISREAAEEYWTRSGDPEPPAPNRESRRSAAAAKTRSRGSTSGTSSRKAKSQVKKR